VSEGEGEREREGRKEREELEEDEGGKDGRKKEWNRRGVLHSTVEWKSSTF